MTDRGGPDDIRAGDPAAPWVERIQAGIDVDGNFALLYKHFRPRLCRYFSTRGLSAASSEELTQEVFTRVFHKIRSFEYRSRFARWLFEIAHNVYANELRRIQAAKRDGVEMPLQEESDPDPADGQRTARPLAAPGPSPLDEVQLREQAAALRTALDTLPRQMRRCVLLRLYQGLKYREIAAALGVSLDTVKAQLGQAKARLLLLLTKNAGILHRLEETRNTDSEA